MEVAILKHQLTSWIVWLENWANRKNLIVRKEEPRKLGHFTND